MQDIVWKKIIEDLFQDFVAFFLPDVFPHIDFSKPYDFLDKEFENLFPKAKKGKRHVDKLVKVFLKSGKQQWILIHAEVQGYHDDSFSLRMYTYFYRIFDKYHQKVISLAILADERPDWKPDRFEYQFFQTELTFKYRIYKLLEQEEENLKVSDNPFALAVLASLDTMKSKRSEDKRLCFKLELSRLLLEKDIPKAKIEAVFQFINVLLQVADEQKQSQFMEEVHKMATANKKEYILTDYDQAVLRKALKEKTNEVVTEFEEAAIRKGIKQGEQKGERRGERRGERKALEKTARQMKAKGFDISVISEVTGLSEDEIKKLM